MKASEYQKQAMKFKNNDAYEFLETRMYGARKNFASIVNASYGLSGEVGELNDLLKKWIFHGKHLDETHAKKELGDVLWYVALMCDAFGWDMDEVMQMNIDKLNDRYPNGFDVNKANHREKGDI